MVYWKCIPILVIWFIIGMLAMWLWNLYNEEIAFLRTLPSPKTTPKGECDAGFFKRDDMCYASFVFYADGSYRTSTVWHAEESMKTISDADCQQARSWSTRFGRNQGWECKISTTWSLVCVSVQSDWNRKPKFVTNETFLYSVHL